MKKIMVLAVLKLIKDNFVLSAHDVSSGGILVSLAEMSIIFRFRFKNI